jgi:hydrophobe/amphiphile efflux-3 (HAE3) family protein
LRKFWAWLGYQSGRRAGVVSIVGLLLTVFLGLGMTGLKFNTSTESYLNKSDKAYKDDVVYENLFGGQAMVVMYSLAPGSDVADLFTPANEKTFAQISQELAANKKLVSSVITPYTAVGYSSDLVTKTAAGQPAASITDSFAGKALLAAQAAPDLTGPEQKIRSEDSVKTLQAYTAASTAPGGTTLANPAWARFLLFNNQGKVRAPLSTFFPNTTHAQLIVRLTGNQPIGESSAAAELVTRVIDAHPIVDANGKAVATVATGSPSLLKNLNDYLRGGMFLLGGIALGIMVVILLLLFRVRWRLLPLAVIVVGLVWAFGVAGYFGIPLTLATIAGLPTLMGIGIDYAIQMHARVEEEVTINRHPHPIQETARNLAPALLVVTFDAIFAFVALLFAKVPMIRQFGALLAVGIAMICLCSIVAPLSALGIREFKSPTKRRETGVNTLGRIVVKLGELPAKAAPVLVLVSLAIFVGGIFVEGRLVLQTDPVEWINPQATVIKNIHALEEGTGSANEMGVFVQTGKPAGTFSDEAVGYIDRFTQAEMARFGPGSEDPKLATASSMVQIVSDLVNDLPPGGGHVAPTGAEVEAAYQLAPPPIRRQLVATMPNGTQAFNIVFRTATPNLVKVKKVVDQVRTLTSAHPQPAALGASGHVADITPSGLAVVGVGLLENLESNRILLTYLSIAFVAVFLAFRLRSVVRSLLSLVPVLIAVGAVSLIAFAGSLELSPMTAVGGPIVVAVCTEFTSLILLRFVEERARGLEPKEAVDVTAARTGRAFLVSACTAIAGVAVMGFSSMPILRDFGIIIGMNVAIALLAALVFLPPMLVWADSGDRNWVSRGIGDRLRAARERERVEDHERWPDETPPVASAGHHVG